MANFIESFNRGIEAAVNAELNFSEIDQVFSELNRQLTNATDGKVSITRRQGGGKIAALVGLVTKIGNPTFEAPIGLFVTSSNPETPAVEIAEWNTDRTGYPCSIQLGANKFICDDKEALEQALSRVLADPEVGKVMRRFTLDASAEGLN